MTNLNTVKPQIKESVIGDCHFALCPLIVGRLIVLSPGRRLRITVITWLSGGANPVIDSSDSHSLILTSGCPWYNTDTTISHVIHVIARSKDPEPESNFTAPKCLFYVHTYLTPVEGDALLCGRGLGLWAGLLLGVPCGVVPPLGAPVMAPPAFSC